MTIKHFLITFSHSQSHILSVYNCRQNIDNWPLFEFLLDFVVQTLIEWSIIKCRIIFRYNLHHTQSLFFQYFYFFVDHFLFFFHTFVFVKYFPHIWIFNNTLKCLQFLFLGECLQSFSDTSELIQHSLDFVFGILTAEQVRVTNVLIFGVDSHSVIQWTPKQFPIQQFTHCYVTNLFVLLRKCESEFVSFVNGIGTAALRFVLLIIIEMHWGSGELGQVKEVVVGSGVRVIDSVHDCKMSILRCGKNIGTVFLWVK